MKRMLLSCLLCLVLGLPGVVMSGEHDDKTDVSLYGRLWPKVTYSSPSNDDPSTDITDAISRLGVSASYKLTDTLTAVALIEARVNLNQDGDGRNPVDLDKDGNIVSDKTEYFLTENLGYVGLESSHLGPRRHRHAVEPVLQHRGGGDRRLLPQLQPFGYDQEGPFREEQIVRYALSFSGVNLDLGVQLKSQAGIDDDFDKVYAGVGYSYGPVYVGLGYLGQDMGADRRDYAGLGASLSLTDDLYLALTYQAIEYDLASDADSLDVAATYAFGPGYTLIGGIFTYDHDDADADDHVGYNLTLVKALTGNVKVFAEWLRKDFQDDSTRDELSLGIRIDFNAQVI